MRKFGMLLLPLLLFSTLTSPLSAQSESGDPGRDERMLIEKVQAFAQSYSAFPSTQDKESVMRVFSPQMLSTIFYFSVSDKVRLQNSSYDGFSKYLDRIARTDSMMIRYEVKDIIRNYINDNVATTVFTVDYEIMEENGFHAKGNETVTFGWRRDDDGNWSVVHFTVLGTEDEKLRGACLCNVFASRGDEYVVRTTVPSGRSYTSSFNEFRVRRVGDMRYMLTPDDAIFRLGPDEEVWRMEGDIDVPDSLQEVEKMGRAGGPSGAILLIVKNYLYADRCSSIRLQN